jgi:hypothetical protein
MRNDAILYAGSSSVSFGKTKEQSIVKDKRDERSEKRGKLKPAAEVVFAAIDKEMQDTMNVKNIDISKAENERMFMIEMMARQKYVEYLQLLQNKLDIILREPKLKEEVEDED